MANDVEKTDNAEKNFAGMKSAISNALSSSAIRDLIGIIVFSVVCFFLAVKFNAFENMYEFSRAHEELELDELFSLLMILSVAFGVYSIRRVLELRVEVKVRIQAEEEIRKLAYYDPLTGVANRILLKDRLTHIVALARRHESQLAILFIDLDGFKQINDTLGHKYGDEVLKNVAQRLLGAVRSFDTVSRIGGDEFIVVLEEVSGIEEINQITERIYGALIKAHKLAGKEVVVTPSIGVSIFPEHGEICDTLIGRADTAMYYVKAEGKSRFAVFEESMNKESPVK